MILDSRYSEVAEYLNGMYDIAITGDMVKESISNDHDLIQEVEEDSYKDTMPREEILNCVCLKYIGITYPTYGDTKEYTELFLATAKSIIII